MEEVVVSWGSLEDHWDIPLSLRLQVTIDYFEKVTAKRRFKVPEFIFVQVTPFEEV